MKHVAVYTSIIIIYSYIKFNAVGVELPRASFWRFIDFNAINFATINQRF